MTVTGDLTVVPDDGIEQFFLDGRMAMEVRRQRIDPGDKSGCRGGIALFRQVFQHDVLQVLNLLADVGMVLFVKAIAVPVGELALDKGVDVGKDDIFLELEVLFEVGAVVFIEAADHLLFGLRSRGKKLFQRMAHADKGGADIVAVGTAKIAEKILGTHHAQLGTGWDKTRKGVDLAHQQESRHVHPGAAANLRHRLLAEPQGQLHADDQTQQVGIVVNQADHLH